nr:Integral membrane protein [Kibdelosporangium sp. MJ126-NF4]
MTEPTSPLFTWHQLPPFFQDADASAIKVRRRYFGQLRLSLILLFVAAASGAASLKFGNTGVDWAGVLAALAFLASLVVRFYIEQQQDENRWYESRTAAESCKTLAWRYAVCGDPFPESMPTAEARQLYIQRLRELSRNLRIVDVSSGNDVNEDMERCRAADKAQRIDTYRIGRLTEQVDWYSKTAALRDRQSRTWRAIGLVGELVGVGAGALKASGVTSIDLLGVVSAAVAGITAWLHAKQLHTEASSYSLTAREIRHVLSLVDKDMDGEQWAEFVAGAEETISKEHTLWSSGRTGRVPLKDV